MFESRYAIITEKDYIFLLKLIPGQLVNADANKLSDLCARSKELDHVGYEGHLPSESVHDF